MVCRTHQVAEGAAQAGNDSQHDPEQVAIDGAHLVMVVVLVW